MIRGTAGIGVFQYENLNGPSDRTILPCNRLMALSFSGQCEEGLQSSCNHRGYR